MKKKSIVVLFLLSLLLVLTACSDKGEESIKVVLDWTPNTNHTGIYVAQEKGYFKENGLNIEIIQPPEDGATTLVSSGKAEYGIDFQDYISAAFDKEEPLPVTAIAALVQHNTSGIISKKGDGIDAPKGMNGKTYASWDLPIEHAILKSVVEEDGGDYDSINIIPSTITDVVTALNTDIDAIWVYYGWDGIAAEVKGLETDFFAFKDIQPVLDYYSPILIANNEYIKNNSEEVKLFLDALAKGYEYAIDNPKEAADILLKLNPELDEELIIKSQEWMSDEYKSDVERWGYIDPERWDNFYEWLFTNKLIENIIPKGFGFTNDYLPK